MRSPRLPAPNLRAGLETSAGELVAENLRQRSPGENGAAKPGSRSDLRRIREDRSRRSRKRGLILTCATEGAGLRGPVRHGRLPSRSSGLLSRAISSRSPTTSGGADEESRRRDDDGALDDDLHLNRKPDEQHFMPTIDDDRRPDKRSGDVPRPPERATPPMTQATIESSSYSCPTQLSTSPT